MRIICIAFLFSQRWWPSLKYGELSITGCVMSSRPNIQTGMTKSKFPLSIPNTLSQGANYRNTSVRLPRLYQEARKWYCILRVPKLCCIKVLTTFLSRVIAFWQKIVTREWLAGLLGFFIKPYQVRIKRHVFNSYFILHVNNLGLFMWIWWRATTPM